MKKLSQLLLSLAVMAIVFLNPIFDKQSHAYTVKVKNETVQSEPFEVVIYGVYGAAGLSAEYVLCTAKVYKGQIKFCELPPLSCPTKYSERNGKFPPSDQNVPRCQDTSIIIRPNSTIVWQ